jgi:hypothetical protein
MIHFLRGCLSIAKEFLSNEQRYFGTLSLATNHTSFRSFHQKMEVDFANNRRNRHNRSVQEVGNGQQQQQGKKKKKTRYSCFVAM